MSVATLLIATAMATAGGSAHDVSQAKPEPVMLSFQTQGMAGVLYGIEGIDSFPHSAAKMLTAEVAPGRRTVWYSCPTASRASMSYDFSAGSNYELVCGFGQEPQIRRIDDC